MVDDYGHHPAEVRATLRGAREAFGRRVVCLFQPHRYTRTRDLLRRVRDRLQRRRRAPPHRRLRRRRGADPRRDRPSALAEAIRAYGHRDVTLVPARGAGARRRAARVRPGDLVLTLGAGDVTAGRPRAARAARGAVSERASRPTLTAWQDEIAAPRPRRVSCATRRSRRAPRSAWAGRPTSSSAPPIPDALAALLRAVRELGVPLAILGGGANTLVADAGVRGVVLRLPPDLVPESTGRRDASCLGAGRPRRACWLRAHALGLVGMEFVAGIPGTLGGAVAMNAGHPHRRDEGRRGARRARHRGRAPGFVDGRAALGFAYRTCRLPAGAVVTRVELALRRGRRRGERAAHGGGPRAPPRAPSRSTGRPSAPPSRNPPGDYAGRLIEAVGLKGHRVGNATWSDVHANFVVEPRRRHRARRARAHQAGAVAGEGAVRDRARARGAAPRRVPCRGPRRDLRA